MEIEFDPNMRIDTATEPKNIYLKVYQDKENMQSFYIDTVENIKNTIENWKVDFDEGRRSPVFEPVLMSESEFDSLPEFQGF